MLLGRDTLEEIFGQQRDILPAAAQRREVQAHDIEAVEQIFAEHLGQDFGFEVLVRGRDDADIGADRVIPAHPRESSVLQHAKEFALQGERHFADLVEEQRSAVRLLEASDALGTRAGEGSFFVTEQLALQQVLRNGRAIDGEEWPVVARAVLMDGASDEFLSRSALAGDHDRRIAVRDAPDHFEHFLHGG